MTACPCCANHNRPHTNEEWDTYHNRRMDGKEGMKLIDKIYKGLEILSRYSDNVEVEHYIIYAGPSEQWTIGSGEIEILKSLGWFFDKSVDSWAHFV